ncbi:50S ribosomal protein L2 [Candidatus Gottesmanbacteria bacterium]|nr:50S ribosomal protein L2 [Candidatus Gottesmanbacteria bacterium]MBI5452258.1 50S ribosomal protein L2 [Candidatus Gottesmanbacteria bacterium]
MIDNYFVPKSLISILPKNSGRNNIGRITSRHQGGREKRYYREIDFKRDKVNVPGKVLAFEYDPNRNVDIVLVQYTDGEKRYILRPLGLNIGDTVNSGEEASAKVGNSLPLAKIPIGTPIHNIELHQKCGGQIVRGAGTAAYVLAKEDAFTQVRFPSGEVRKIHNNCYATVGQLANVERKTEMLGKAGRSRHMGIRPKVRGTAQNPRSHPHGGGEGRSGEGLKQAKTPWGKSARGLKTRKKGKYSDKLIVQKRSKK